MNQCSAVALLPPPEHALALSGPGHHHPEAGHVLCELGEDHDETHAAMLWDEGGRPRSTVWVQWDAERARSPVLREAPDRRAPLTGAGDALRPQGQRSDWVPMTDSSRSRS
ncbi:hypothetical protein ACFV1S_06310 [Streptomyces globisporus]|uniref:hypothetical protein n=1 Tax=Streptomyces TaxID=1883 RepID=UPI001F5258D2|nr:hypothetical protein [Streptomyces sp. TSRI0445]